MKGLEARPLQNPLLAISYCQQFLYELIGIGVYSIVAAASKGQPLYCALLCCLASEVTNIPTNNP